MKYLYILLVFIPITIAGKIMGFSDTALFLCSALAIVPLAGVMGKATDDIAGLAGQRIGGLLNATFGNREHPAGAGHVYAGRRTEIQDADIQP